MIATGDATKAGLEHCGAARLTAELAKTRSLTVADCSRRVRRDELWSSLTSKALTTMANAIDLQVHRHRRSGERKSVPKIFSEQCAPALSRAGARVTTT